MPVDGDRAFTHAWIVTAARSPLNAPCRCHSPCVYNAPNTAPFSPGNRTHYGYPQHRHHRPRRPWQDHAGGLPAEADRHLPRQRAGRRARHGLQRPRARARHHHPGQVRPRSSGRARASTSSTRPATPTSAARSSASCRWSTAWCCWSTPPKARCRRPSSCSARRCGWACKPIVVINKVDRSDAGRTRCTTRSSTCSRALGATDEQLDFPNLYASARQGWAADVARGRAQGHGAAVRPDRAPRAGADGRQPTSRSGCW